MPNKNRGGRKPSPKPKREITAHKGGRTKQMHGRFTAEEIALIESAMGEMSFSDWCVSCAKSQAGQPNPRIKRDVPKAA